MTDNRDHFDRVTPVRGDWGTLLGKQVRVRSLAGGPMVMGEGEVVAVCFAPSITVRAQDGSLSHHSTELPIEVAEWRRL